MNIRIYQINPERDKEKLRESTVKRMDQDPSHMKAIGIDASVYDRVFSDTVHAQSLAEVYDQFRYDPPKNYIGDTLRLSDVVEVIDGDASQFYFLATYGMYSISFDPTKTQNRTPEARSTFELGLRLGVTLTVTKEELDVLIKEDSAATQLLMKLVQSDRSVLSGDTYFPQPWNEDYLGDDLNFYLPDTPLIPLKKLSLDEKIQASQPLNPGADKTSYSLEPEH